MSLLKERELIYREMIYRLYHLGGNREKTARSLGISSRTLRSRLNAFNMQSGRSPEEQRIAYDKVCKEYFRIYCQKPNYPKGQ